MLRFALFLLAFLPALAWGRVGETRTQMEARYGSGKEIGDQTLYTTEAYALTAFYAGDGPQGCVVMEIFGHRPTAAGEAVSFTQEEIDDLLKGEGGDQHWVKAIGKDGGWAWCRADGQIFARPEKDTLVFRGRDNTGLGAGVPGVVLHDGKK